MRHRPKLDANQAAIVAELRAVPGVSVEPRLAAVGHGCPDIAVGFRGATTLWEIKDPEKPPSKQRLTEDEAAWHSRWTGHVSVATTARDILREIGAVT